MKWRREEETYTSGRYKLPTVSYCKLSLYKILAICSYPRSPQWVVYSCVLAVASVPASPCVPMKNWKERQESGKFITWGIEDKWTRQCFTGRTVVGTRRHLHYVTWQYDKLYGKHTQTHTFENHGNLLAGKLTRNWKKNMINTRTDSCENTCTCTADCATTRVGTSTIHLCSIKPSLVLFTLCITHGINIISGTPPTFSYCKQKLGGA